MVTLKDYVITTIYFWLAWTFWLTPWAFFVWGLTVGQWWLWFISGIPSNLLGSYPITWIYLKLRRRSIDAS